MIIQKIIIAIGFNGPLLVNIHQEKNVGEVREDQLHKSIEHSTQNGGDTFNFQAHINILSLKTI